MRFKKQVYIDHYTRSEAGAYTVYYKTGDLPDAEKPLPFTQARIQQAIQAQD
jgi:hypothetical protein